MDMQEIRQNVVDEKYASKTQAAMKGGSDYLYAAVKREVAEMSDTEVLGYAETVGILEVHENGEEDEDTLEDDENGEEQHEA